LLVPPAMASAAAGIRSRRQFLQCLQVVALVTSSRVGSLLHCLRGHCRRSDRQKRPRLVAVQQMHGLLTSRQIPSRPAHRAPSLHRPRHYWGSGPRPHEPRPQQPWRYLQHQKQHRCMRSRGRQTHHGGSHNTQAPRGACRRLVTVAMAVVSSYVGKNSLWP